MDTNVSVHLIRKKNILIAKLTVVSTMGTPGFQPSSSGVFFSIIGFSMHYNKKIFHPGYKDTIMRVVLLLKGHERLASHLPYQGL